MAITRKAQPHSEHQIQKSFVKWFRLQHSRLSMLLYAVPNGAFLNGTAKQRAIQWKKLKSEGAVSGVADLFLSIPNSQYHGLYIESKTPKGRQSKEQKMFQKQVEAQGYKYYICRELTDFIKLINDYLNDNGINSTKQ